MLQKSGFIYVFRGLSVLRYPDIKWYVLVPFAINLLIYVAMFMLGVHTLEKLQGWMDSLLPSWLTWLEVLLWPVLICAWVLFLVYGFTTIANLVAAPFNSYLSEKIERQHPNGRREEDDMSIWQDICRTLKREWQKTTYYLPRAIGLLLLTLIPGVNLLAGVLWCVFSCWMLAIQYLDYPMDNRKIPFPEMLAHIRSYRWQNLAFGGAALLFSLIPVASLLAMPASVAGATLKYLDEIGEQA